MTMVGGRTLGARTLKIYIPLVVCLVAMLFPFYWMAITSIKPNRELYNAKIMPLIVHQPTLKHYYDLLTETNFLTWTYNTMLVAVVTTVVSLVIGTMMAYPLARLRFPGAALMAIGVAATYLVPQPLLFIPMADIINRLDLGNTLSAVMLTYPTLLIPFCAWLLMGYFKSVPRELEEAARIDGASRLQAMLRVVLPLRRDLRLHAGAERVPLRADLPRQVGRAHGAGGRHHRVDSRRRLLLGAAHGGRAARLDSGGADLLVLRGLLRGRADRGVGEELTDAGDAPRARPPCHPLREGPSR
jgi:ABC-type glycerol-3-phosphate transport system permease component